MTVNKARSLLEQADVTDQVTQQRVVIATELVEDIARLESQMKASKKRIRAAVDASGTTLCDIRGIGPIGAAIILGSVGDITRFPTAGHFASYNATAPMRHPQERGDGIGSTREGTANSTTSSTPPPSPSSATPAKAGTITRRNSPKERPPKKPSGR